MDGFVETPAGYVPRVRTHLLKRDRAGTVLCRMGLTRSNYTVVPGLYCTGNPGPDSPVLVTANYKLTFDAVRSELSGIDAWVLVADTRGINVWCAAGKSLFSTAEIILSVNGANLHKVVNHRRLILPQLGATGVAAHEVKKGCGFKVLWGPVRASDLPEFLKAGNTASPEMRSVTFTLKERAVLIPVELYLLGKLLLWVLLAGFLISGIGPDVFSFARAWHRGTIFLTGTLLGILSGCAAVPLLLSILPWRAFWPKGVLTGAAAGLMGVFLFRDELFAMEPAAFLLWTIACSSYLAMNFTGSTPYTSPSGVEYEMRRGIPFQAAATLLAAVAWITAPFFL